MTTPDPQPESTTGLEPGGGVPPGETPPGEASTVGPIQHEPAPGRAIAPAALIIIGILVLVVVIGVVVGAIQMM